MLAQCILGIKKLSRLHNTGLAREEEKKNEVLCLLVVTAQSGHISSSTVIFGQFIRLGADIYRKGYHILFSRFLKASS